ncbi:hypothetical protein AMK59_8388, partial [Oryctes borbonicus]
NQRRQLSPTQQGHILSDIQQHQHRFNLQQNVLNTPPFPSQQTPNNFNPQNGPSNQQFAQQQRSFLPNQQLQSQPIIVPSQQTFLPSAVHFPNQAILPTVQTNANPITNTPNNGIVQHLTQTAFTPYKQQQQIPQINVQQQLLQATSAPLFNNEQVKPLTPEEQTQRQKDFEEKQAIIERHNQFVEKQYKKALEKAQEDHEEFLKQQEEDKKKLYQKLYKPTSQQYRYRQNRARYIYPEERELFNLALSKYYEEHPTTTTSTTSTTTTTPAPVTVPQDASAETHREARILNQNKNVDIFLSSQSNLYPTKAVPTAQTLPFSPTILPEGSELKPITSLEDLDKLKDQYKSQQINKDDLIAQLKLAIGNSPPQLESNKNLTFREISLPNGEKVEIIRTTDPELVSDGQRIEPGSSLETLLQQNFNVNAPSSSKFPTQTASALTPESKLSQAVNTADSSSTSPEYDSSFDELIRAKLNLPDGHKYEIIKTTDPKLIPQGNSPGVLTPESIKLPNGQSVQVIKTTNPSSNPLATSSEQDPSIDELIKAKLNLPDGDKYEIIKTTDPNLISKSSATEEIKLPNGQKIQVIKTTDPSLIPTGPSKESDTSLDELVRAKLNLPDGHKYEIIRTTDPKSIPSPSIPIESPSSTVATIVKPPTEIFDELTKDVLPAGANFDILRHNSDGLEKVSGLPSSLPDPKKVAFVLLEEQDDGTVKVQGVKGNSDKDEGGVDVDSILKQIKDGEIKLPPPSSKNILEVDQNSFEPNTKRNSIETTSYRPLNIKENLKERIPSVTVTHNSHPQKESSGTTLRQEYVSSTTPSNIYFGQKRSAGTSASSTTVKTQHSPTVNYTPQPHNVQNTSPDLFREASTVSQTSQNSIFNNYDLAPTISTKPTTPKYSSSTFTIYKSESLINLPKEDTDIFDLDLTGVLKRNGLFAMSKYLRQSGLDTILNETGPYTLFVPNDKAFRTLLVQLGGPDKAEEKFRDNPRLLSGLLLHHVIPGAFKIGALQDEMTGVSLAGTQLRVNQYTMHDVEWNDVKVTTINGAKVIEDKQDIIIPQGIAHAIDRVMFPLPVGDLVQTLQSDRERRFTSFLRALFASGLAETFQGIKTFTLFAPTERAFTDLSPEDLSRTVTEKKLARELVLRHILSGTLYTNGIKYYQVKDTLNPDKQITISKTSGKVKVNNNSISTQNIPATNGVIHAVDFLL